MCALDQEHAKLISASEDELEVEALSRVTVDTRWKINLFRWAPSTAKSKEIVNLLFAVQSQTAFLRQSSWLTSASLRTWAPYSPGGLGPHLTRIFLQHLGRFGKQWQLTAAASVPFMEVVFIFCKRWEKKFGQQPFLVIKAYLVEETMLAIILSKWSLYYDRCHAS